jgi:hypothetical protein
MCPASAARPHLYHAETCGWYSLSACQDCGSLWVDAPYEPCASFLYSIRWPYSRASWDLAVNLQDGLVINAWCDYKIRKAWPGMSESDRRIVEIHRQRSYGRNPIDDSHSDDETDPLAPYLDRLTDRALTP